jgi:hypothetical protein
MLFLVCLRKELVLLDFVEIFVAVEIGFCMFVVAPFFMYVIWKLLHNKDD